MKAEKHNLDFTVTLTAEDSKFTDEAVAAGVPLIVVCMCRDALRKLVASEREACAKVCDAECNPTPHEGHITTYQSGGYIMAEYLASAIRARGQG